MIVDGTLQALRYIPGSTTAQAACTRHTYKTSKTSQDLHYTIQLRYADVRVHKYTIISRISLDINIPERKDTAEGSEGDSRRGSLAPQHEVQDEEDGEDNPGKGVVTR